MVKLWSFGHPNMKWYILRSWIFAMVANGGMALLQLIFGSGSRTIFRSTMGVSQAAMFDGSSINFVPHCHPQHIACIGFVGALFWPVEVFNHNQTTANPPWKHLFKCRPKTIWSGAFSEPMGITKTFVYYCSWHYFKPMVCQTIRVATWRIIPYTRVIDITIWYRKLTM